MAVRAVNFGCGSHYVQVRDMLYAIAGAKIDPWASEAHYLLDRTQMMEVLKEASKFSYSTPELVDIESKLALSEQEFVKLQVRIRLRGKAIFLINMNAKQLKRANEMNDPDRIINREIRLKELYLQSFGPMFVFDRWSTVLHSLLTRTP
jgi:hypothetical protein